MIIKISSITKIKILKNHHDHKDPCTICELSIRQYLPDIIQ